MGNAQIIENNLFVKCANGSVEYCELPPPDAFPLGHTLRQHVVLMGDIDLMRTDSGWRIVASY